MSGTVPGGLPDPAELRTLVARLRQETEAVRAEAETARDEFRALAEQSRAERDQALADLHRAAREGRLGTAGERIAERVEDGESRWIDVLHERDPSPEAAAVRRDSGAAVEQLVDELAAQDPELARLTGREQGGSPGDLPT